RVNSINRTTAQDTMLAGVGPSQEPGELAVEILRGGEPAARQEGALQVIVQPLHQTLGLRVGRLADDHLRGQRAAERLAFTGQLDPDSPSHTNTRGTAPSRLINSHQPAYRSSADLEGSSIASANREQPHTMVNTGSSLPLRVWPNPT